MYRCSRKSSSLRRVEALHVQDRQPRRLDRRRERAGERLVAGGDQDRARLRAERRDDVRDALAGGGSVVRVEVLDLGCGLGVEGRETDGPDRVAGRAKGRLDAAGIARQRARQDGGGRLEARGCGGFGAASCANASACRSAAARTARDVSVSCCCAASIQAAVSASGGERRPPAARRPWKTSRSGSALRREGVLLQARLGRRPLQPPRHPGVHGLAAVLVVVVLGGEPHGAHAVLRPGERVDARARPGTPPRASPPSSRRWPRS